MDVANADDDLLHRIDVPGDDRLERRPDLHRDLDRVDGAVGHRAVTSLALDPDLEHVRRRLDRAAGNPDRSDRHVGQQVLTEDRVNVRILQHARLDHRLRATAVRLFRGLEEQFDVARELVPPLHQQPRDAQEHRRVPVMPTGVHDALGLRLVVDVVLFVNRQRIHVSAEQDRLARTLRRPANEPGDAGLRDAGADVFDAKRFQPLADELGRLRFLETQLRVLVQPPPVSDDAGQDLVDLRPDLSRNRHQRPSLR